MLWGASLQQEQERWSELMGIEGAKYRAMLEENLLQSAKDLRLGRRFTSSGTVTLNIRPGLQWNDLKRNIFMC